MRILTIAALAALTLAASLTSGAHADAAHDAIVRAGPYSGVAATQPRGAPGAAVSEASALVCTGSVIQSRGYGDRTVSRDTVVVCAPPMSR